LPTRPRSGVRWSSSRASRRIDRTLPALPGVAGHATSSGPGPNCEIGVMGQQETPALQKSAELPPWRSGNPPPVAEWAMRPTQEAGFDPCWST
jgi:hypothetical protein